MSGRLKKRQRLGKYRIEGRIAEGNLCVVYRALDTIQDIRVALKVPNESAMDEFFLQDFKREAKLAPKLEHESILPIRDASFIDDRFVIVMPLGSDSLAGRMRKRISTSTALSFTEQMLSAVARAHEAKVIHCDIKPDNFIVFPGDRVKLADFGFSKIALRTLKASGSGTVGYIAPEQAVGRPMFQSDVFSVGLVIYELFSGHLPEWPYSWPPPQVQRVRARIGPKLTGWLRKAIAVQPEKRYRNAVVMLREFRQLRNGAGSKSRGRNRERRDDPTLWRDVLFREFQRKYKAELETRYKCTHCSGPVAEPMRACPWCGAGINARRMATNFPAECPRCCRGSKLDWEYCPWCYGKAFEVESSRRYSDKRYTRHCESAACRGPLMPFMRYCPWCRNKVSKPWKLSGKKSTCKNCNWGVDLDYWHYCPWCTKSLGS